MIAILGLILVGFYFLSKKIVVPSPSPIEQASPIPSAFATPTISKLPEVEKISESFFETPIFSKTLGQIQDVTRKILSGTYATPIAATAEVGAEAGALGIQMSSVALTAGLVGQADFTNPYSGYVQGLGAAAAGFLGAPALGVLGLVVGGFLEGILGTHETPLSSSEEISLTYSAILDRIDREIISKYGGSLDLSFVKARSNPFNYKDIYDPSAGGGTGISRDIRTQSWEYTMAWRALTYTPNIEVRDGMLITYDPTYGQGGQCWIPQVQKLINEQVSKAGGYIELMAPWERAFYEFTYKPYFIDVPEGSTTTQWMTEYNIAHP